MNDLNLESSCYEAMVVIIIPFCCPLLFSMSWKFWLKIPMACNLQFTSTNPCRKHRIWTFFKFMHRKRQAQRKVTKVKYYILNERLQRANERIAAFSHSLWPINYLTITERIVSLSHSSEVICLVQILPCSCKLEESGLLWPVLNAPAVYHSEPLSVTHSMLWKLWHTITSFCVVFSTSVRSGKLVLTSVGLVLQPVNLQWTKPCV